MDSLLPSCWLWNIKCPKSFDYNWDSPPYYWDCDSPNYNSRPIPEVADAVSQYLSGLSSVGSTVDNLVSALSTTPSPLIWTEVFTPISITNSLAAVSALFPPPTPPLSRTSEPPVTQFEILATTVTAASPLGPQAFGFPVSPELQHSDPVTPANLPVSPVHNSNTPAYDFSIPVYSPTFVEPATEQDWFPNSDRSPSPIDYNYVAKGVEALSNTELDIPAPVESAAEAYARLRPATPFHHPVLSLTPVLSPCPLPPLSYLDNQENVPPAVVFPDPPCINQHDKHPHQFIGLHTLCRTEYRPWNEVTSSSPMDIPPVSALVNHPPLFPTVQPFQFAPPHHIHIIPKNTQLANYLRIPNFIACCKAICILPNADLPLGLIKYSFATSLANIFEPYNDATKAAFISTLVIFESLDFFDGRLLTTYGYLNFGTRKSIFLQDPGFHCEDNIQVYPHLLNYCLTPHLPVDPFIHASVHPDNIPLPTTWIVSSTVK